MEPIQTKSKSGSYVVVAIIVILIILILTMSKKDKDVMQEETPVVNNMEQPVVNTPTPTGSTTTGTGIDPQREGISTSNAGVYANLMLKYKDRMVQFNKECAVVSNKVGFKQGTDILLDNRDNTPVKIVIGSRTFYLPGYGYKVIDLPTVGSFQLDCNSRLNVVTVTVQK